MGPYNAVAGGPFQTGGPEPGGATVDRDVLEFDVVIVGAGPAGLAAAIRLRQLSPELSVCVLEKGAEVGAHILSGAVLETRALDELLPGWREAGAPVRTAVARDRFLLLTGRRALRLPTPPGMGNRGNHLVSLGLLCRWLAQQAEALGVEIFPGFAAAAPLFDEEGAVAGVAAVGAEVEVAAPPAAKAAAPSPHPPGADPAPASVATPNARPADRADRQTRSRHRRAGPACAPAGQDGPGRHRSRTRRSRCAGDARSADPSPAARTRSPSPATGTACAPHAGASRWVGKKPVSWRPSIAATPSHRLHIPCILPAILQVIVTSVGSPGHSKEFT